MMQELRFAERLLEPSLRRIVSHANFAGEGTSYAELMCAFDEIGVGLCVCDPADFVLYVNPLFRGAFLDGAHPASGDFIDHVLAGMIPAGRGLQLNLITPEDFARHARARRREQKGNFSFTTDTADGRWWRVTDSRLSSGMMMSVAQDITVMKQEEFKLRYAHASALQEASTDFLTGVPNRRYGFRHAESLFANCSIAGDPFTAVVLDIDYFKTINDTHGHDVGDRILIHFANVVNTRLTPRDGFSRIGGEEFLLVSSEAAALEQRLAGVLYPVAPLRLDEGRQLSFTVSGGLAVAAGDETFGGLLHRADRALYDAKARGRDRIERAPLPV